MCTHLLVRGTRRVRTRGVTKAFPGAICQRLPMGPQRLTLLTVAGTTRRLRHFNRGQRASFTSRGFYHEHGWAHPRNFFNVNAPIPHSHGAGRRHHLPFGLGYRTAWSVARGKLLSR